MSNCGQSRADFFPQVFMSVENDPQSMINPQCFMLLLGEHKSCSLVFLSPSVYPGNTSLLSKLHVGIGDDIYLHRREISLSFEPFNSTYHLHWTSQSEEALTNGNQIIGQIRPDDAVYKYHRIHNVLFYQHCFVLQHTPCHGVMGEIRGF